MRSHRDASKSSMLGRGALSVDTGSGIQMPARTLSAELLSTPMALIPTPAAPSTPRDAIRPPDAMRRCRSMPGALFATVTTTTSCHVQRPGLTLAMMAPDSIRTAFEIRAITIATKARYACCDRNSSTGVSLLPLSSRAPRKRSRITRRKPSSSTVSTTLRPCARLMYLVAAAAMTRHSPPFRAAHHKRSHQATAPPPYRARHI